MARGSDAYCIDASKTLAIVKRRHPHVTVAPPPTPSIDTTLPPLHTHITQAMYVAFNLAFSPRQLPALVGLDVRLQENPLVATERTPLLWFVDTAADGSMLSFEHKGLDVYHQYAQSWVMLRSAAALVLREFPTLADAAAFADSQFVENEPKLGTLWQLRDAVPIFCHANNAPVTGDAWAVRFAALGHSK